VVRVAAGVWVAISVAAAGPAFAADVGLPTKAPPSSTASSAYDWTGFYVGAHLGYSAAESNWSATQAGAATPSLAGTIDLFQSYDVFKGTGSYLLGLQAGYNYMLPNRVVVGVEADASFPSFLFGSVGLSTPLIGQAIYQDQTEFSGTVRGRIGYAPGNWLFYATGGFAYTYDQITRAQMIGTPVGGTVTAGTTEQLFMAPRVGAAVGVGAEVALTHNWLARFEYLYTGYGSRGFIFPDSAQRFDADLKEHTLRVGLDYKFGDSGGIDPDLFTKGPTALDLDRFAVHGQTTFIGQYAGPFHAPYHGQNSLDSNAGRETWDATLALGWKIWQGGEIWVDPEIDQGYGLSNTLGIAGFTSGAAFKVGSSVPYPRIQRYFLRQTIDLGGDTSKVEADFNQFAGSETANRLVLTIGKYSASDVFDTNKYSQNPRKDFMNWSLIDAGSWDYAADAWGYAYGASAEWYQGPWTFRGGIFDLSIVPNSTELDPTFSQFQWLGEIERRYDLWGHPGKIAVTGFLSRGRMGNFDDAIALAQITGGAPDVSQVRIYRSRPGIDMNLEQELTSGVALFARAGKADGSIEPYEYTDIDYTASAGLSFNGKNWGRPDDTFAFAGIVNGLSASHIAYFNAGGLGILVGDGQLPNPSTEKIIETYYQFPLHGLIMTLDYQFVVDPGYNRERGPVSVFASRLHAEF